MKTYKNILYILFLFLCTSLPSLAEKVPVKIAPMQVISTHHDDVEIGDWIKFEAVKDVYLNDNLYIKKGTEIIGIVDFIHQNGWGGDCAEICFKNFYTKDVNNNKVKISYPLNISGQSEMATSTRDIMGSGIVVVRNLVLLPFTYAATYIPYTLRGSEIFVEPDTKIYNIFIER